MKYLYLYEEALSDLGKKLIEETYRHMLKFKNDPDDVLMNEGRYFIKKIKQSDVSDGDIDTIVEKLKDKIKNDK